MTEREEILSDAEWEGAIQDVARYAGGLAIDPIGDAAARDALHRLRADRAALRARVERLEEYRDRAALVCGRAARAISDEASDIVDEGDEGSRPAILFMWAGDLKSLAAAPPATEGED